MKQALEQIKATAEQALHACTDLKELDAIKLKFLGKKDRL